MEWYERPPEVNPIVVDNWEVVDQWWTSNPLRRWYAVVTWNYSEITFVKTEEDPVYRIVSVKSL